MQIDNKAHNNVDIKLSKNNKTQDNISKENYNNISQDPEKMLKDIYRKMNIIINRLEYIEERQNKILFLFKMSYIASILYWSLILLIALGVYVYFKDIMLYIFNNSETLQTLFKTLENFYKLIKTNG